jgi:ABC-type sugar transport system ATPase subunit
MSEQATRTRFRPSAGGSVSVGVELGRLHKRYGRQVALEDVSLTFLPGTATALLGHNGAGKSTLVKILSGIIGPDEGSISIDGTTIAGGFDSPAHARAEGVVAVQQDLNLIRELSLLENWALTDHFSQKRANTISWRRELREVLIGLERLGLERRLRPLLRRRVSEFTPTQRAWANLAIALLAKSERRPRIVVLDEITSAIEPSEARELVGVARRFTGADVSLVIVTHGVEEALAVSDRVVVLRDGRVVGDQPSHTLAATEVVASIVGAEAGLVRVAAERPEERGEEPLLRLGHLRTARGESAKIAVGPGEVLGLTGLPDSGAFELPLSLATGRLRATAGVSGRSVGYIPGDRSLGVLPQASVRENMTIASLSKTRLQLAGRRLPYLSRARARARTEEIVRDLKIRLPSLEAPISQLSGGNQQKVILGRWLLADVKVLVLEEPLQGLDIGAKGDFLERILLFARHGGAVLYVASDADELVACCGQVVVMRHGYVAARIDCSEGSDSAKSIVRECYA